MTPHNNHDEDTRIFNNNTSEETALDNQPAPAAGAVPPAYSKPGKKGHSTGAKVAAAIGGGIFLGGIAALTTSMAKGDAPVNEPLPNDEEKPDWLSGDIKVATGVNDDMSFDEAFAAARAEVGPGGAFEWHGGIYGTYTSSEWNQMSAADRAEWSSNFDWNHVDTYAQQPQHVTHVTEHVVVEHHIHTQPAGKENENVVPQPPKPSPEKEFEVLGVVHDDENNTNVGIIKVNGQEAYVIDVDNDLKFDLMAYDQNGDGQITEDEFIDISGGDLTVASLGGFTGSVPASDMAQTEVDSGVDYTQTRTLEENIESESAGNNNESTGNNEVDVTAHAEVTEGIEAEDNMARVSYVEELPAEITDAKANAQVEFVSTDNYASSEVMPAEGEVVETAGMVDVAGAEYDSTENLTAQYQPAEIPVEGIPMEDIPTIDQDIASADDILNIQDDSFDNSHLA